ncbi:MAG: monovalent cation/hydrogen antiporter [Gaiellales bacterium]|nr:monovalent cation/hydrogen antiporter [Gaiellales bacterium]
MSLSHEDLFVLFALVSAVTALLALAPKLRVPYPILMVIGGLALGFVPGMPEITLPPEVVLVGVLPPLLYSAAFFTSLRDLRANARAIGLLAIGLVGFTTVSVAVVVHEVTGLAWGPAFVLGAIVSPTDPIAATSIAERLGIPRRLVTIIEGESLVNDGTALVAYRFAVAAVVTGHFSVAEAAGSFIWSLVGGVGIGLAVGWVIRQIRRRLDNPPVEITIALMTGYFAYIPAELAGASAVLAVVTAGVYIGWHTPELTTVQTRLQGDAVWEILTFLLNALLFVLIGLQLPAILDSLSGRSVGTLIAYAAAVVATVIVVRLLWVYPAAYIPRWLSPRLRERDPYPPWQAPMLLGWAGMRGAVSLAAALALPLETDAGTAFPARDLIIFLTFAVILGTLVLQGLSLPLVIRWLGLEDDRVVEHEETKARVHAAEAALARIEELAGEDWVRDDTAERLKGLYQFRRGRFASRFHDDDDGEVEERSQRYQQLMRELLDAERQAVVALRGAGGISDEAMRRVLRDLDLEEARLDA